MSETAAPISIRLHDGHLVALAPEAIITPAFNGAATLTISSGNVAGDRIKLSSQQRYGDQGWGFYGIAYTIDHPEYGKVIAAYVDMTAEGLADAPGIRAIRGRQFRESAAAEERANAEERRIIAEGDR